MKIVFDMEDEESMMDLIMTVLSLGDDVKHIEVHIEDNPSKPEIVQEVIDARNNS
ncbi:MAG: hypothetical protein GX778_04670 [Erysipelothrix sp.]|nr:hypothetical protein [Erysipelothrix sp.]